MLLRKSVWLIFVLTTSAQSSFLKLPISPNDDHYTQLNKLIAQIHHTTKVDKCFAIITDSLHQQHLLHGNFFAANRNFNCNFLIRILDSEDMLSPNYQTVKVLQEIRANNCDLVFILILNGAQLRRFLLFAERHRILNPRAKFVMLFDYRILTQDMLFIWRKMVTTVFIKTVERKYEMETARFDLLTVPYPNILKGTFVSRKIVEWKYGKFEKKVDIFLDKTNNLEGYTLKTAAYEHFPLVIKDATNSSVHHGLEVEIIHALAKAMNFTVDLYETADARSERWGRVLENGSYTGLVGEMSNQRANIAIGDLQVNPWNMNLMDFSIPHSRECLTFLTPESSQDNSWKTMILPFSGGMWAGVVLSLLLLGITFYLISWIHSITEETTDTQKSVIYFEIFRSKRHFDAQQMLKPEFKKSLNHYRNRRQSKDLFDDFSNCMFLTYSMLLYVSLPHMPRNWPLRMLTGWYWIYCILVVVTYRASFTAILANPAPRITIDNLKDLAASNIHVGAWGAQNKQFFEMAFDEEAQKIGAKLENVDDILAVADLISKGYFAYYDNEYFLRFIRSLGIKNQSGSSELLHIMKECVIYMPIAIGLEKNSPLKPNIDKYLRRLIEGGLISKWLKDAVVRLPIEEDSPQEALIDLKKFWSSFVALGIGYFFGIVALIFEKLHYKYVVETHPLYDKYNRKLYYNFLKMRY